MTDHYLSAAGSDAAAGTFAAPWKTISRLNSAFAGGTIGLRDSVLFNRGDTFYGCITPPTNLSAASPGWLKFGAYGSGALPVITGYKILNTASGWVSHDANTWKVDYSAGNAGTTYTGYDSTQDIWFGPDIDVGFLKVDGVIKAVKRSSLGALAAQWDFYSTGTTLYVRSTAKPTTLAADIRCVVDTKGIMMKSGIEVADLAFIGHGSHGVRMTGQGATRCRLLRCTIGEIGGSYLDGFGDGTVRLGNGVEVWATGNTSNFYAEHNTVYDCYDTAYTIQGGTAGIAYTATDIIWRRNLTYRNTQCEEYWYGNDGANGVGPGFVNCVSEYNTNLFAGYGYGSETRPDPDSRVFQLNYHWGTDADITLRRNVYYDARHAFAYSAHPPSGLDSGRNMIFLRPSTKMLHQDSQTIEQAAAWAASRGRDTTSAFGILPSSADTDISNADVTTALAALDGLATTGQMVGAGVYPIHSPWRA